MKNCYYILDKGLYVSDQKNLYDFNQYQSYNNESVYSSQAEDIIILFIIRQMYDLSSKVNALSYNQFLDQDLIPFQNPICKQTYQSLPRIYGNKKTNKNKYKKIQAKFRKIENIHVPKYSLTPDNLRGISRYLFPKNSNRASYNNFKMPSSPPIRVATQGNSSKYDIYRQENIQSNVSNKKVHLKPLYTQVKAFDLSDLQTPHKVGITPQNLDRRRSNSELQKMLIENRKKSNTISDESKITVAKSQQQKFKISIQNIGYYEMKNSNECLSKRFANPIQQIQQQNQQQNPEPLKKLKDQQYNKSQAYTRSEKRQKSAISLSRYVFSEKNDLTMFRSLQKNKNSKLSKSRRSNTNSVLSTGLFRIPEEVDYRKYILNYQPMSNHFNFLKLAQSPTFKVIKDEKSVYFGEVNDKEEKHGLGLTISQKEIFQGQFNNNLKIIGFERNIDGTYIGGYKNGTRSGEGQFNWNNGQVFKGNWQNGMKNGYGVWRAPQGHFYEGQWSQNRQHGQGVYKHNTSTYKGSFFNFLKHGHGQQVFINGDKYIGQYKQGKPDGKGRYEWNSGGVYQGEFKEGKRQGFGVWFDSDGTKYEGQFTDDLKHGKGKQYYKTGQKFIGIFSNGSKINGKLYNNKNQELEIIIK